MLLIFSFQFDLHFFHISAARQHQHCGILLVLIRNNITNVAKNLGRYVSSMECTAQGNNSEFILTVKM